MSDSLPNKLQLPKRMLAVRHALCLTQRQAASRLGVSQGTVCKIELGHHVPRRPILAAIAALEAEARRVHGSLVRAARLRQGGTVSPKDSSATG